ncbi:MAG: right-handed parallel beta-helix repeat-containing protein, partial [Candidatus Thorarchaeota archaeon]
MAIWRGRYRAWLFIGAILGPMIFLPQSSLSAGPTYVSGDLTGNVVWTTDQSPIVIVGNTTVTANSVLTVQAGTEVKFEYLRKITVNGQIVVDGQPGSEVTFTSNLSSPYAGSWVAIEVLDSLDQPVSSFNYCEVQFGGYGLWASSASVLIRNTTVSGVLERGIYAVDSELNVYDSVVKGSPMVGIDIASSWGELSNNLVRSSGSWGMMISDSDISLVGNILEVSGTSMLISDSSATVGEGNVIDGGSTGIRLDRANGTDISGV